MHIDSRASDRHGRGRTGRRISARPPRATVKRGVLTSLTAVDLTIPRTASRTTRSTRSQTALDLLKTDHAEVKKLFNQFEKQKKSEDDEGIEQAAQAICQALSIHVQIEEEIFYPALRAAADADDELDEADVEHSDVKELVSQVEEAHPGDHFRRASSAAPGLGAASRAGRFESDLKAEASAPGRRHPSGASAASRPWSA
ncbi:MAG: hemerythrin domain-containing protein, partial [Betaproteobacteria bacterium]